MFVTVVKGKFEKNIYAIGLITAFFTIIIPLGAGCYKYDPVKWGDSHFAILSQRRSLVHPTLYTSLKWGQT